MMTEFEASTQLDAPGEKPLLLRRCSSSFAVPLSTDPCYFIFLLKEKKEEER